MTAVVSPSATAVLEGVSIVLPCHNEEANVAAAVWNRLVDWTLGLRVRDVDCAFKLIRRSLLDGLELTSSGAVISAELLARSRDAGARICESDVRHLPRNAGRQSGLRPRVVVRASAELLRLRRTLA